jgi:hypothetical protein
MALEGAECLAARLSRIYSFTQFTGGWVGPRADLDTQTTGKILFLCRGLNPGRPARSQTLY